MAIKMKRIMLVFWLIDRYFVRCKSPKRHHQCRLVGWQWRTPWLCASNNNVNVTILDNENTYSKAQAEMVIKDFFAKHQPKAFSPVHESYQP
jgi:hypothetical protein